MNWRKFGPIDFKTIITSLLTCILWINFLSTYSAITYIFILHNYNILSIQSLRPVKYLPHLVYIWNFLIITFAITYSHWICCLLTVHLSYYHIRKISWENCTSPNQITNETLLQFILFDDDITSVVSMILKYLFFKIFESWALLWILKLIPIIALSIYNSQHCLDSLMNLLYVVPSLILWGHAWTPPLQRPIAQRIRFLNKITKIKVF